MHDDMKVYFISGLGADRRVFKYISLPDGFEIVYIDWILPLKAESLQDYAWRLAGAIDHTKPFVLLGLSLGGMIVSEIAKKYKPVITILVSSVPVASQLPRYLLAIGKLHIQHLVPSQIVKSAVLIKRLFTIETTADKKLIIQMLKDTDMRFIRWSAEAIAGWKNKTLPVPYIHIHGVQDRILPIRFTKPTYIVQKGGHLIIMSKAAEINQIIKKTLAEAVDFNRYDAINQ